MSYGDFVWVEFGAKKPGYFIRNVVERVEKAGEWRKKHGNTGVFMTAYRWANPERTGALYAPYMYIDLDDPGLGAGEEPAKAWQGIVTSYNYVLSVLQVNYKITREFTAVYFSGCKGLSILIPTTVFGLEPAEDLNEIFRLIAEDIAAHLVLRGYHSMDLSIYDRVRLWRMENSRHETSGLYKVRLTHEEVNGMPLEEIRKLAAEPRPEWPVRSARISQAHDRVKTLLSRRASAGYNQELLKYEPPCIKSLLQTPACPGRRNITATALASHFYQRGLEFEETAARLLDWNREMGAPPLPADEVVRCVRSVYRHGYRFGCATFAGVLDMCVREECRFKGEQRQPFSRARATPAVGGRGGK